MPWNFNVIQAPRHCDVLLYTNTGRHVVAKYIPTLAGVASHWPLPAGEYPIAWCEMTVPVREVA